MIDPRRQKELIRLLERLGINCINSLQKIDWQRIDWEMLDLSLIHPSYSTTRNNDRLEFIGDSVLRMAATLWLQENYADSKVGELAALRSHLVSDRTIAEIASAYNLDSFLLMSNSARNDTKALQTRLAAALEALLAALYLSTHNFSLIRSWLDLHLEQAARKLLTEPSLGNYKVALQELTQERWKLLPDYKVVNRPSDRPGMNAEELFTVEVWFRDRCWGEGQGKSIKAAQQAAAAVALKALQTS
ncbi:MAG: ribonuclease III [Pseudanabaena sp. RU_4_16]|nr:ribonuclease III [Pseudanabaena sp. SU_2_4]NJM28104.1 ribonuclease III [Pseudanabaena sp. RU_4_16]